MLSAAAMVLVSASLTGAPSVEVNCCAGSSSISATGARVAFVSTADDLVSDDTNFTDDLFVRDVVRGRTERANVTTKEAQSAGSVSGSSLSASGNIVAFASGANDLVRGDTNSVTLCFEPRNCDTSYVSDIF